MFNHSKSSLKLFPTCKYRFYLSVIEKAETLFPSIVNMGTRLHGIFEVFFYPPSAGGLDKEVLWLSNALDNYGTTKNEIYIYFIKVLLNLLTENEQTREYLTARIKYFANFQAMRWGEIRMHFKEKEECLKFFYPIFMEKEIILEHPEFRHPLKGIIDAVFITPTDQGYKYLIVDYKTGNVPRGIMREARTESHKYYSTELPNPYVREGSFYALLFLLTNGYNLQFDGTKWSLLGKREIKTIEYMFVFVDFTGLYIARKKTHIKVFDTLCKKMKEIERYEDMVNSGVETWKREPSDWICPKCNYFLTHCAQYLEHADLYKSLMSPDIYAEEEEEDEAESDPSGKER